MSIDYRDLLARYIRHVQYEEGADYLEERHGLVSSEVWSDEEWEALQQLRALSEER